MMDLRSAAGGTVPAVAESRCNISILRLAGPTSKLGAGQQDGVTALRMHRRIHSRKVRDCAHAEKGQLNKNVCERTGRRACRRLHGSETRRGAHPVKGAIAGGDGHRPPLIGERPPQRERPHKRRIFDARGRGTMKIWKQLCGSAEDFLNGRKSRGRCGSRSAILNSYETSRGCV